jgi:hypothetical protein
LNVTLYLSHERDGTLKDRERVFGEALKKGFERHGEHVNVAKTHEFTTPDWSSQLAVVIGIKGHSKRIYEEYRRGGRQVMLVDKSYIGRTAYVRLSVNGFQPPYMHTANRPDDRWRRIRDEFSIDVKPKRGAGEFVIYAGSSQKYCDWHGLGDATVYASEICHQVGKKTRLPPEHKNSPMMPVLYRPKPSWAAGHPDEVKPVVGTEFSGPEIKLGRLLPKCHTLVTHGSNAAVEAIIAGVPVLCWSDGACAADPMCEHVLMKLLDPYFPDDAQRLQWLANLAYCQFNLREIEKGDAWAIIAPHTVKASLAQLAQLSPDESVIAQYRMMHTELGPKMYRGNATRGHVEAIADLVTKHAPVETMLDYGSGKGRQYDDLNIHDAWGGIKPTCYDPGYPPLATKPEGKFDGVICTDVAEHVPEASIDAFLQDVVGYATKFVFFCIFTEPSRKFLPDGRNCHLTTKPRAWWIDKLCSLTGGSVDPDGTYMIGEGALRHKHWTIKMPGGPDVVVTFRGTD